jgi:hypothetical protein
MGGSVALEYAGGRQKAVALDVKRLTMKKAGGTPAPQQV